MHLPCGFTHHDERPSDVSGWCRYWAEHGAQALRGDEVEQLRKERAPKDSIVTVKVTVQYKNFEDAVPRFSVPIESIEFIKPDAEPVGWVEIEV